MKALALFAPERINRKRMKERKKKNLRLISLLLRCLYCGEGGDVEVKSHAVHPFIKK